jgi:hypothetical protein
MGSMLALTRGEGVVPEQALRPPAVPRPQYAFLRPAPDAAGARLS